MATVQLDASDFDGVVTRVTQAVLAELRRKPPDPQRVIINSGTKHRSPADRQYGYELGCDGMVPLAEAKSLLGGVCRTTVWKLSKSGAIRSAKILGCKRYCRRSLLNYLKPNETTAD